MCTTFLRVNNDDIKSYQTRHCCCCLFWIVWLEVDCQINFNYTHDINCQEALNALGYNLIRNMHLMSTDAPMCHHTGKGEVSNSTRVIGHCFVVSKRAHFYTKCCLLILIRLLLSHLHLKNYKYIPSFLLL